MRDPYSTLGVKRSADADEIKAAWRSKAKTVHPDHNQGDPSATSRFAEIGEAYEVLKDPERRKRYDKAAEMHQTILQQRQAAREAAERARAAKANADKVMEELARAAAQKAQAQAQQQGQNQASQNQAGQNQAGPNPTGQGETPEDVIERIFGAQEQAKAQARPAAAAAAADAADPGKPEQAGERPPLPVMAVDLISSFVRRFRGGQPVAEKAPDIFIDANVSVEDLLKLNTTTLKLPEERELRMPLEKGMTEGHVVRLKGQGLKVTGMKQGDLVVTVRIARDMRYRAEGFNLHTSLPVSLQDAVLGTEATIETPDGSRSIAIPAWSGSDQTVTLSGLGLHNDTGGRGDLVVELRIVLWEKPDEKVTDLMRHMRHGLYL